MASIRGREGRWQARVIRKGFPAEVRTFDSRALAVKWARSVEAEMDAGRGPAKAVIQGWKLENLIERYLASVTPSKRGAVAEAIRLKAMCRQRLSAYSLANLTPERIAEYRDERLARVGPATVIRDLALLSSVINHARREWGLSMPNPCALVRRPAAPAGRDRVLSAAEEAALLTILTIRPGLNKFVPFLVILAVETAMRRGELLALKWDQVDLANRTAYVPVTKNGRPRSVPLSKRAIQALSEVPRCGDDVVFPISWMALDKAFVRGCVRAGIEGIRFHDLRHTATSRLAVKLPNLIELSSVTGHKTMQMLKRYYHPKAAELALKLD